MLIIVKFTCVFLLIRRIIETAVDNEQPRNVNSEAGAQGEMFHLLAIAVRPSRMKMIIFIDTSIGTKMTDEADSWVEFSCGSGERLYDGWLAETRDWRDWWVWPYVLRVGWGAVHRRQLSL